MVLRSNQTQVDNYRLMPRRQHAKPNPDKNRSRLAIIRWTISGKENVLSVASIAVEDVAEVVEDVMDGVTTSDGLFETMSGRRLADDRLLCEGHQQDVMTLMCQPGDVVGGQMVVGVLEPDPPHVLYRAHHLAEDAATSPPTDAHRHPHRDHDHFLGDEDGLKTMTDETVPMTDPLDQQVGQMHLAHHLPGDTAATRPHHHEAAPQ
jgi:hypothetical protein